MPTKPRKRPAKIVTHVMDDIIHVTLGGYIAGEISRLEWYQKHPQGTVLSEYFADGARQALEWLLYLAPRAALLAWDGLGRPLSRPSDEARRMVLDSLKHCAVRSCSHCGCTEEYACRGGCSWSNDADLCTRCLDLLGARDRKRASRS